MSLCLIQCSMQEISGWWTPRMVREERGGCNEVNNAVAMEIIGFMV